VVTDQGVTLETDGITVQGPPGVAPPGTTLTATRAAESPVGKAAALFAMAGEKLELNFGGLQPTRPLTVTFPVTGAVPEGAAATVLTHPSGTTDTHLIPATFDPVRRTVSADIDHLSDFWPGFLDFGKLTGSVKDFLGQTTGITSAKPECAGKAATGQNNIAISLSGDITGSPVWPCIRLEGGNAVVTPHS
jgi:hypothetical protein